MKTQKWKSIEIDTSGIPTEELVNLGGIEELLDYRVIRESDARKSKKRKVTKVKKEKTKRRKLSDGDDDENDELSMKLDMSAWNEYLLHDSIIRGLRDQGFQTPTEIQSQTIPAAVKKNQDILGAAETGSGKTLAFGIPIVNRIISAKERMNAEEESSKHLYCLILTPTRELAIQIKNHLQAICKYTDIQISVVVGGMAPEKQRRILKKCPEIVVATPGRLWELIEEGQPHVSQVPDVRFLVIDEADRMMEKGHFAELTQILSLINGNKEVKRRQTFVFSATLTLVHEVPTRLKLKNKKVKTQQKHKLESLVKLIGLKDPKVIDITKKTAVVDTLTESQIMCSNEEKDSYLYYFLLMHPGRTIVFCNSIECVRRLRSVLEHLECRPLPLHASMQQRQRLKNLDRFERSATAVLLATDVAARGLDIKNTDNVIHFQVPRTAETYVHRSGRTARAQKEGLSLVLIEPQDGVYYKKICKTLSKEHNLPSFPVDQSVLKLVRERVSLVRSMDQLEHRQKRLAAQNRWFLNTAKEADVEIDDRNLLNDLGNSREQAAKSRQINAMKKQLKLMLRKPIVSKLLSGCYPTKSGKLMTVTSCGQQKAVKIAKKTKRVSS